MRRSFPGRSARSGGRAEKAPSPAKPIGWQDAAAVGRMVVDGACLIVMGGEAVDVDLEEVGLDFRVLLVILEVDVEENV